MFATSKRARQWNTLVLLTVGLAAAIFAWGLRYKLSMYKTATHTVHHVVVAKLISDRERSADTSGPILRATTPAMLILCAALSLLAGFALAADQQSVWLLRRIRNPRRHPDIRALSRLFSRPPPAVL